MTDLLIQPGAWTVALCLAGILMAAAGLVQIERARVLAAGVRTLPARWGMAGRFVLGHLAAVPLVTLALLVIVGGNVDGLPRLLLGGGALALYLWLGIVIPRKPITETKRERRRLRALTPGFVSYVRVALAGYDAPPDILTRYVKRPNPRRAPMQQAVLDAIRLMHDHGMLPFAALRRVARARGCQEFIDIAEALAQAEVEGTDAETALAAFEATLTQVLQDEFQRMLERRKIYLLVVAAFALIIGILGQILYVMVAGSGVLGRL
jgi:hypothetical protein